MQLKGGFSRTQIAVALALASVGLAKAGVGGLQRPDRLSEPTALIVAELNRAREEARNADVFVRFRLEGRRLLRERSTDGMTFEPDGFAYDLPEGVTVTLRAPRRNPA